MPLKDMAQHLLEEIWALFEPILPARIGCGNGRPPKSNRDCFHALLYVLVTGMPWELLPGLLPILQNGPTAVDRPAGARRIPSSLAAVGRTVSNTAWDQLLGSTTGINYWDQVLLDGSKKPAKKGANKPGLPGGPGPMRDCLLQLACDGRAMPLGAVVTSANARDGCHTEALPTAWDFFAQFSRIGRRLDRSAQRLLGWIQWAACLIFLRSGFVR